MHETFELYLKHSDGPGRFQAVICDRAELVRLARTFLKASDGDEVEVCRDGLLLFTLVKEPVDVGKQKLDRAPVDWRLR